ncbi:MAG: hypothetical protein K0M78_07785 [Brevundimonas sp.]|nr:hypothetical protein [Brevundimonas sp.]
MADLKVLEGVTSGDASLLLQLLHDARQIFIKKLSNNDRDWARFSNKHQAGAYIPLEERDSGFFPAMTVKERSDGKTDEIREVRITASWPQVGEEAKVSRLVNYRSKGEETHLTGLPKGAFASLSPGSYLVIGRIEARRDIQYRCLTVDSESDDALVLNDALSLPADFQAVIKFPAEERERLHAKLLDFTDLVLAAWQRGEIRQFADQRATMPGTAALAGMARDEYLNLHGLNDLNPFRLECPGDAIREISRVRELAIFREYQLRSTAIALVILVAGEVPGTLSIGTIIRRLIDSVRDIDALMLSASQQRRSRAGYSFEHHIEAMLLAGEVPFEKQVVMEAKKRPDFVLPSLKYLRRSTDEHERGLILSAKTTLRERWKQVQREMGTSDLFLATVDETIAGNAIKDMSAMGITLVVPEKLKAKDSIAAKAAEYRGHKNVLSFREFFHDVLREKRMPSWLVA